MGGDPEPHPVRLVDDRGDLLAGHLGGFRVLALHRPGAGGHDLDVVGAVADLLADGPAHLPRPVGLAVHRAEDPGAGRGRTQDPAARQDPRPLDEAELDGATQDDRLAVIAADVTDGRDPRPEHRPGRVGEDEPAQLARARIVAVERWRRAEPGASFRVARDVGVRVDQARHQGPTAEIEGIGWRCAGRRFDAPLMRPSAIVMLAPSSGAPAAAIDEPRVPERPWLGHRRRPGGPFVLGAVRPRSPSTATRAPARDVPAPAPRPRTSGARSRRARPLDRSSSRTGPIRTRTSRSIGAPTAPNIRRSWRFQPWARIARYQTRSPGGGARSVDQPARLDLGRRAETGQASPAPRRAGSRP